MSWQLCKVPSGKKQKAKKPVKRDSKVNYVVECKSDLVKWAEPVKPVDVKPDSEMGKAIARAESAAQFCARTMTIQERIDSARSAARIDAAYVSGIHSKKGKPWENNAPAEVVQRPIKGERYVCGVRQQKDLKTCADRLWVQEYKAELSRVRSEPKHTAQRMRYYVTGGYYPTYEAAIAAQPDCEPVAVPIYQNARIEPKEGGLDFDVRHVKKGACGNVQPRQRHDSELRVQGVPVFDNAPTRTIR